MELFQKAKLLFTRMVGISTPEEADKLDKFMQNSPRLGKLYSDLSDMENYEQRQQLVNQIDIGKEWEYFRQHRSRRLLRHSRPVYRWAAVITLPILAGSICAWLFFSHKTEYEKPLQLSAQTILPGSRGATLILSNGKEIELKSFSDHILEQNGNTIQTDSARLNYAASNNVTGKNLRNRIVVGRGFEYMLILSDGTKVWMNSESTLQYPVKFNSSGSRKVELTGEAYFEVAHNANSPFIVEVNGSYAVKVLGTSFNINAYTSNPKSETTLVTGSIEVTDYRTKQHYTLTPDKQIVISPEGCLVREVNTVNHIAWHEGLFYFENQKLDQVLEMLGRWYNVDFEFESDYLKSLMVTGKLQRFESLQTILQMLTTTTGRMFEIKNKLVYVKEKNNRSDWTHSGSELIN